MRPLRRPIIWVILTAAMIQPGEARAYQDPTGDTLRVTVPTSAVRDLFTQPPSGPGSAGSVDPTVLTSQVEALFRGTLTVEIETRGNALDPDGYTVVLTEGSNTLERRNVTANDLVSFPDLRPGSYAVQLLDVDEPCTAARSDPSPVEAVSTVRGRFEVTCTEPESFDNLSLTVEIAPDLDGARTGQPTIRVAGRPEREISADAPVTFDGLEVGPTTVILTLPETFGPCMPFGCPTLSEVRTFREFHVVTPSPMVVIIPPPPPPPSADGWHVGVAAGAVAVAASGPASFFTPTVSLSAVRGPPSAEWLYLTAQAGWRPSGPSGPDPVIPSDPRPPFQDRSFRTLSLGATVFPADWWGVSAAWVGGWEMARDYDKYLNRSLGFAVGPRIRLLASRRLVLGLDLQYAQVSEFELDDPRWRFDLTPAVSFGYVFR